MKVADVIFLAIIEALAAVLVILIGVYGIEKAFAIICGIFK